MESILQLYGLAVVVLPVYGFVSLRKRVRYEHLSRGSALLRYAGLLLVPLAVYAVVFALALGVESLSRFNPVSEEIARSFPLAIALGLAVWLLATVIFSLALCFVRVSGSGEQRPLQ